MRSKQRQFNQIFVTYLLILAGLSASIAEALPIGFGYNQGDLEFMEMRSPHFIVYFDKRAPEDAKIAIKSLEAAKPHVEKWFGVERSTPLIVNMSANSDNASFANFITDSIELQTMGQGGRDLAWHEYVHSTMYRHLDNFLGPAGAILHLPWMEAWFLEGLAESLSVAIGSDEQAGVERYHALSGKWPSWDRIHSLYTSGPFNYRGYATSGAFVAWILRTYGAEKLPEFLQVFRSKSMPWYWPWALTPLNGFLPMDSALRSLTEKSGLELYEQYKTEATSHWKNAIKSPVLLRSGKTLGSAPSPWSWQFNNGKLSKTRLPKDAASHHVADAGDARAWISTYYPEANKPRVRLNYAIAQQDLTSIDTDATWVEGPWLSRDRVWWIETLVEQSRLCHTTRRNFKSSDIHCITNVNIPERIRVLGVQSVSKSKLTKTLWLSRDREQLTGDTHEILQIDLDSSDVKTLRSPVGGRPISLAAAGQTLWMLVANRSWRQLVKLDPQFNCSEVLELSDFPVRAVESSSKLPHLVLFSANGYVAVSPQDEKFVTSNCKEFSERSSPLLVAMRSKDILSLKDAVNRSSIWAKDDLLQPSSPTTPQPTPDKQLPPTGEAEAKFNDRSSPDIQPATWRGRPVFAFPWLGAEDPLGAQLGVISVPLMDHMQNETVRATVLMGLASRFPYQDVTLLTNRFKPTWSVSGFRAQTYNGRYRNKSTNAILSGYLEEIGFRVEGSYAQRWRHLSLTYDWGFKGSNLKPYIGPTRRRGHLNEPYASISATVSGNSRVYSSLSLRARGAPAALNRVYQYDVVGASITSGMSLGRGKAEAGLDGSRTRGPRRRDLQELYQPLKTLIPGSGAGLNQNSFALTTDQGLFSPVFGENQARARLLLTHPIMENFDKFLGGLIYIDRLVGSGFFNYGTAWRGQKMPSGSDLTAAHGYSVDLFMDNKGVNFNLGAGAGQVLSRPWQAYWTFGFDALF